MTRSLENLIKTVKELPDIKQRGVAAIIGATVADAATRPFHWLYDQTHLKRILGNSKTPEFWPENKSPIYSIPLGSTSSYNDVMQVSLMSLKENHGKININHICESIKNRFGESTMYSEAYVRRMAVYDDPTKSYTDKRAFRGPVDGPWVHGAVLKFLENYSSKTNGPYGDNYIKENDGYCLIVPIIVSRPESKNLWNTVAPVASLLTTDAMTTKMFHLMTILLSGYVQGLSSPVVNMKDQVKKLYPNLIDLLNHAESNLDLPYTRAISKYGIACYQPGSFIGAYLSMMKTSSYVDAVRLNITGGGCNCSRANIIGCCFGAKYGIDSIPIEWMEKVNGIEEIFEMAIEIISN